MGDHDRRAICPQVSSSKLRNVFRINFKFDTCTEDCQEKFKSAFINFLTVQNKEHEIYAPFRLHELHGLW
jgi:hypothetical protein